MQRVVVVGNSGSGKSTLAAVLSERLGAPHTELDSIFHQPGWTPLPKEEFRARAVAIAAQARWVVDGNYSTVRDLLWARADTVVWLDLPLPLVTARVVRRSAGRVLHRTELWNGNRERLGYLLSFDPERSIIAWSIHKHRDYRRTYAPVPADPRWAQLRFVRLRSPAAVRAFLNSTPTP